MLSDQISACHTLVSRRTTINLELKEIQEMTLAVDEAQAAAGGDFLEGFDAAHTRF